VTSLKKIVLASSSPRRYNLLQGLALPFCVVPSGVPEDVDENLPPEHVVTVLAERKVNAVRKNFGEDALVLAADTIVTLDSRVFGKPRNQQEAKHMLRLLAGRIHVVYTGVSIGEAPAGRMLTRWCATAVKVKPLSDEQIARYVATGEPLDKAGSYAIQGLGATIVESICGDYFNVVGLPLCLLSDMLLSFGIDVLARGEGSASLEN
jgi:septum formation protein